jgi:hypothetical protein
MEVRFRPLQASNLARHVTPGQLPSENGQDFLEVVESLTGSEQLPDENPGSDHNREERYPLRKPPPTDPAAAERAATSEDGEHTAVQSHSGTPRSKIADEEKPVGRHIDMTV